MPAGTVVMFGGETLKMGVTREQKREIIPGL
jgi:hypothetical protein